MPSFARSVTRAIGRVIRCVEKTVDDWFLDLRHWASGKSKRCSSVFKIPPALTA